MVVLKCKGAISEKIDHLAGIVKPHIGVITNIGVAHMESLGSREGIFQARWRSRSISMGVTDSRETLVYAGDSEFLTKERTAGAYHQISVAEKKKTIISYPRLTFSVWMV